ncbi:MAG: right-handed parallel beta-helix repeat-containing protein [Candidatus Methylacidiphilales bacterium]
MNDIPREKLREILARHGKKVGEDARLCQALLTDYCGEHRGENYLLVSVVRERLVMDMVSSLRDPSELPVLLSRLGKRMETNLMVAPAAARWALLAWAEALELVPPNSVSYDETPSSAAPKPVTGPPRPPGMVNPPPNSGIPRPPGQLAPRPPAVMSPEASFIPNVAAAAQAATNNRLATGRLPNVVKATGTGTGRVALSPFRSPPSGPMVVPGSGARTLPPDAPAPPGNIGPGGTILRAASPLPVPAAPVSPLQGGIGVTPAPVVPPIVNRRGPGDYDIVVSKSGLGDFDNIEAAVTAALPGNVILVQAGVYNETVVLRRSLTLVADLSGGQVIVNSDGTCLDVQADVAISGFTFSSIAEGSDGPQPVVRMQRGNSRLIACTMGGPSSSVVEVSGGAFLSMEVCEVYKSSGMGVRIKSDGGATLEGCRIQRSGESAMYLEPRARVTLSHCRLEKAAHYGICAEAEAIVAASECEVTGHARSCVFLNRSGSAQFEACQLGSGQAFGLHVVGSPVTLESTTVSECKQAGISLTMGARLDATNSKVLENREEGIIASGRSAAGLVRCTVQGQTLYGIYAAEKSEIELNACTIGQNGRAGVAIYSSSRAELQDSTVVENKGGGLSAHQESTLVLRDSALMRNSGVSLLLARGCKAGAERSRINEGDGEGIYAEDESEVTAVSCRISGQGGHGVAGNAAVLALSVVEITGNQGCGVYLAGRTTLQAERCVIRENLGAGVKADWGAGGALRQCEVINNGDGNITKPFFSSLRVEE